MRKDAFDHMTHPEFPHVEVIIQGRNSVIGCTRCHGTRELTARDWMKYGPVLFIDEIRGFVTQHKNCPEGQDKSKKET